MSGEIVNLRMARKRRDRGEKARQADENRAIFGQTKAERSARKLERARFEHVLDDHEREVASRDDGNDSGKT